MYYVNYEKVSPRRESWYYVLELIRQFLMPLIMILSGFEDYITLEKIKIFKINSHILLFIK